MEWLSDHSVVQFIGVSVRKSSENCGYCKTSGTDAADEPDLEDDEIESIGDKKSVCLGLGAIRVFTKHINQLVDQGWNWSGRYLYKPIMEETCCPLYTIRLDALKFKPSRSQRRVLRIWNEFLKFDKRPPLRRGDVQEHENRPDTLSQTRKKRAGPTPPVPGKNRERKLKNIRKAKAIEKLRNKGVDIEQNLLERKLKEQSRQRTIESFQEPWDETFKHKLEIRTIRVGTTEFNKSVNESFLVYEKYQQIVHRDKRCSRRGYQSFLVDSPFIPSDEISTDGFPRQGSYHMQYLIDGKIVAVGVVDLLPQCLSSAYFYYDPDYAFLNLGSFSALKEIEFVREIVKERPELHYYYMGYYVHSCRKMRYKGNFSPSELLCEQSHEWVPLPECQEMIEKNEGRFTIFRPDAPPASTGNVWECKPLRYQSSSGTSTFEKLSMNAELAEQLSLFGKYFGDLCPQVYIVV